ncbi:4'-phosphopantetheinyl transferase superfamily protein [Streptomyces sp. NPDC050636]|uniref:4'-phosphopantetheinyl transferase family protein n=1 Tax=Streptomyces sp. NPDC050636 TaxID=3154510 RepID=UPI003439C868
MSARSMLTHSPRTGASGDATPVPFLLGTDPLPTPWEGGTTPRVWSARVTEYAERAAADAWLLDGDERARAQAFVREADRDRYRVAHVVLRRLLGAYLSQDPAAVELVREPCPGCGGPHGRPAVAGSPLHFSLSHSGDLALFAFAETPVGVDVEAEPSPEASAEVAAVLHPAERAELAALPPAARPASLARCWARKEAYLKGIGIGLAEDPSVTYVGAGPDPADPSGWSLADVPVPRGYAAACAVRTEVPGGPLPGPGRGVRPR